MSEAAPAGASRGIRGRLVWDWPTRAFHWLLVALIVSAYVTRNFSTDPTLFWHRINGYAVMVLLLFRLFWGFFGSGPSRFAAFWPSPRAAIRYAWAFVHGRRLHVTGHNPLGGLLIWAMLLVVAAQAGTGLFTSDDSFAEGPFAARVPDHVSSLLSVLHARGFKAILILTGVHVTANLAYQFWLGEPLITAMITGRKPMVAGDAAPVMAPLWRAGLCLTGALALIVGGLGWAGVNMLR